MELHSSAAFGICLQLGYVSFRTTSVRSTCRSCFCLLLCLRINVFRMLCLDKSADDSETECNTEQKNIGMVDAKFVR